MYWQQYTVYLKQYQTQNYFICYSLNVRISSWILLTKVVVDQYVKIWLENYCQFLILYKTIVASPVKKLYFVKLICYLNYRKSVSSFRIQQITVIVTLFVGWLFTRLLHWFSTTRKFLNTIICILRKNFKYPLFFQIGLYLILFNVATTFEVNKQC